MSPTPLALTDGFYTVLLDADFQWADEYNWRAVEQSVTRGLTGALIVQRGKRVAGRPITLRPDAPNGAWITRTDMQQLLAWADDPAAVLTLTMRGEVYRVIFAEETDAEPVIFYSDPRGDDYLLATLRFLTVQEDFT